MSPDFIAFMSQPWFAVVMIAVLIWTLVWKGLALWRAATDDNKLWFVLLLILNTVGVLEIVYIFAISPMSKKLNARTATKKK
jgi:hypothetical protein